MYRRETNIFPNPSPMKLSIIKPLNYLKNVFNGV